ncbi:MAG TPA: hypothetical protein DCR94_04340 [Firmicutes bacterium]|nr:hypothetical protein [Bacillota bacterium]
MNSLIFFSIISILLGASSYIISSSIYICLIVLFLSLICLLGIVVPTINNFLIKQKRRRECSSFINGFIVCLSVTPSLDKAYENATANVDKELKKVISSIESLTIEEKLNYLSSYFGNELYPMFLSIISIYQVQGGNILNLSGDLLSEANRIEESDLSFKKKGLKNTYQFCLLWGISLLILIFMRIALSSFYSFLKESPTFLGCIIIFYVLLLFSLLIYVFTFTSSSLNALLQRRDKHE